MTGMGARSDRDTQIAATPHPAVKDAYEKGYQDGVLETLSQLTERFPLVLPVVISEWASDVRAKVEADRG